MQRIVVSAPGKVIIHGEHAVVFGKRALAASLGLRTTLTLYEACDDIILLDLPDIGIRLTWLRDELSSFSRPSGDAGVPKEADADMITCLKKLAHLDEEANETKHLAVVAFLYLFYGIAVRNGLVPCFHVEVRSHLPTSAGLGSSAAYSVCLASGLLLSTGNISQLNGNSKESWSQDDLRQINEWAFMAEKIIHGRPSGIDNSVSTYGGALCFQGGQITPLQRMPNLRILLVNTKVPRSTKILVEGVRKKYDKYPEIVKPVLDAIEVITSQFESIIKGDYHETSTIQMYETMKDLIDMNQQLLVFLGVSHPTLDEICRVTIRHGLHSKLTGAGGGGCAMALIPNDFPSEITQKVILELDGLGFECFETSIGGHGVTASVQPLQPNVEQREKSH